MKPSPRRAAFLLAPKTTDGQIACIFREKFLSLKKNSKKWPLQVFWLKITFFGLFSEVRDGTIPFLAFSDLKTFLKMTFMSFFFPILTFGYISTVHFHRFSTHTTHGTLVRVICDFRRIENRFTAPETRCLEKRVNFDCLGI